MALIERRVVLQGKTEDGDTTIDLPITSLENIEDTAEPKDAPADNDYIPIVDMSGSPQMKKTLLSSIKAALAAVFAAKSHTHNYAGSSSAGGAADSANKLNTNAGSATNPVYFVNGVPVKTTHTLEKSVPSNAVFTDTKYGNMKGATTSAAGTAGLVPAPATGAANRYLRSDGTWQVPPDTNTTYAAATASANGLMTAADKAKLDGIAAGATKNAVDTALSTTSTNAVQNKAVTAAINGKAASGHTHDDRYYTEGEVNNLLNGKAASSHTHDDRYYTEAEVNNLLNGKANASHTHNYAAASHNHSASNITSGVLPVARGGTGNSTGYVTAGQKSGTTLGEHATAEGESTTASGYCSHAQGKSTVASGYYSFAGGIGTVVNANSGTAIGHYNAYTPNLQPAANKAPPLVIGNGSSDDKRSNAFRVSTDGKVYGGTYSSSGADYSEYFEWSDANPENEDRRGLFVTLDGDKIRSANSGDDFILGVVSGDPSVIGDAHDDQWNKMYVRDIFGSAVFEDVEIPEEKDEDGNVIIPAHSEHRMKLNPDYDNTQKYIPRSKRPEWSAVGMMGKLVVVDDGTCVVNGWCTPSDGGVGTNSKSKTRFRVMERLDESHVRVLIL